MKLLPEYRRFVTIEQFWRDMLGMHSRTWFYNHQNDPGFPQRFYIGGKPLLVYDDCLRYIAQQQEAREPERKPEAGQGPESLPRRKKKPGRPTLPPVRLRS